MNSQNLTNRSTPYLRCKFRSDLATQVMWLRPREGMTGLEDHFDRDARENFRFMMDPVSGKPVTGETLTLPREAFNSHISCLNLRFSVAMCRNLENCIISSQNAFQFVISSQNAFQSSIFEVSKMGIKWGMTVLPI